MLPPEQEPRRSLGDIAVTTASILLAASSACFASYMLVRGPQGVPQSGEFALIKLDRSEPPIARPPAGAGDVDPLVTGTIDAGAAAPSVAAVQSLLAAPGERVGYRLRTVVARTAFVDMLKGSRRLLYPVKPGTILPGLGEVLRVEVRGGRWVVVTRQGEVTETGIYVEAPKASNVDQKAQ
jgi:hypothetical protein